MTQLQSVGARCLKPQGWQGWVAGVREQLWEVAGLFPPRAWKVGWKSIRKSHHDAQTRTSQRTCFLAGWVPMSTPTLTQEEEGVWAAALPEEEVEEGSQKVLLSASNQPPVR